MKHISAAIICILTMSTALTLAGCSCNSGSSSYDSEPDYDGTYYWEDFQSSHSITISGDTWMGEANIYGEESYDSGYVKDNKLYDDSGYYVIGTISGNHINYGNSHTLIKQ